MSDLIGGYRCLTPMQTAGSGSARWCMAMRGFDRFFLKEFLSPVYPAQPHTALGQRQLERCEQFEYRKQSLYAAASCVLGDVLVPVIDFFRENGHYYAVSEAVPDGHLTLERADRLTDDEKQELLYDLTLCMQRIHAQGIVHADLKPEHVLLIPHGDGWKVQLIDLDSGFLLEESLQDQMEGDPAYLAPETFLFMMGERTALSTAVDVFALGALIHQIWTGRLPDFDRAQYQYLYEAALEGAEIHLDLPEKWEGLVRRMLCADPAQRPLDAEVTALFTPSRYLMAEKKRVCNSLSRLMKG